MATNLRLRPDAAAALKAEAQRTGQSQQEILRLAVDEHLGLVPTGRPEVWPEGIEPPHEPYRRVTPTITLPPGVTSLDILNELSADRL